MTFYKGTNNAKIQQSSSVNRETAKEPSSIHCLKKCAINGVKLQKGCFFCQHGQDKPS